jgi:hypothetical protein
MKRAFLILAIASLALPATALGKGPSGASIEGPGAGGGITFTGGRNSGLFNLTEQAGLFPAVFARQPDPMLDRRPNGDLGPKYTIVWTIPGSNNETWKLKQDLYPYAASGPVTYMKPGQEVFRIPGGTHGGWFQANSRLKKTLVAAGLPSRPVAGSSDGTSLSTNLFSLFAVALFLAAATAVFLRRRARPATA